ncbi:ribose-5-phosphate isomerase [Schaalia sp. ZJ405]|uniref:ribose-5-phosphate isomerase n=1 Tax=unclassified Schaalia TaxID=2691889 RepID=UPI0013EC904C|nr:MULTISPECIES: ribose-5-phosphate isomerase [unclassified Schaalia]QPK80720.1 ribose-5-phosphate isomerase [Schaalia sp. ZJ405]
MRVHIGTDHAGLELKNEVVAHLEGKGYDVVDHGAHEYDALDDYPPFCFEAAQAVVDDPGSLGVVIGGSGNGEQMAANCVKGVRAALVWNDATARLAREHNNANVVSVGARQHSIEECFALIDAFLETPFSEDERHQRRIDLMAAYEDEHRR